MARSDRGMTLVELLVAMMLLTIVIGLATGALIVVLDKQSNISQASDASQQNQTGMELLSRVIRQGVYPTGSSSTSTIIQSGTTNQLVITSRLSSTAGGTSIAGANTSQFPTQVAKYTFTLTGTTLYWQQANLVSCAGSVCTYGAATTQKALIRGVQNNNGPSVCSANASTDGPFHYVSLDGSSSPPIVSTASATTAYVTVNFYTQTQTGPQKPSCTLLSDYVELRNK